ncbi:SDR family NAD(P)-dependent oxidoreductase [Streptomonospora sp. S1-112]|uniref:SDR family NAD(P)-dependent oxidoreductase n=1 Tax=Streptomonospora mangrovi TaxID=2883123 RepID=A0A9X3NMD4_9ACTN|nr:SDR family NAD(P)-dependent oxidoreductase [Streptomonospora mangrovi]MDA0566404.1 SDR family NAD(P)-dependent oxidoreductase [Streptomonospora mangrovi]
MDTTFDMTGMTVVITGASSGIGLAAARRMAAQGAAVVPVGRSPERTAAVAAEIGTTPVVADFGDLAQVRLAAEVILERCPRIDVLANNAGALFSTRRTTPDGHELTFQANHLAPFLLTQLLLPRLRETARSSPVRVVTTASFGNVFGKVRLDDLEWEKRRYGGGWIAYSTTKLMNILFTRELARRTAGTGIAAYSFHPVSGTGAPRPPGQVTETRFAGDTRLMRLLPDSVVRRVKLTGDDGAEPLIRLAGAPDVGAPSGGYFHGFHHPGRVHRQADDADLAARLWERSAELVAAHTGARS